MVLEHQGLPNFPNAGLQPALQLYAAAAAHLAPRNRGAVAPWAPFLQFGMPGVFGSPFLTRPRFAPSATGSPPNQQAALVGLSGLNAIGTANGLTLGQHNLNGVNRTAQGPPSDCSNDEGGKLFMAFQFTITNKTKETNKKTMNKINNNFSFQCYEYHAENKLKWFILYFNIIYRYRLLSSL